MFHTLFLMAQENQSSDFSKDSYNRVIVFNEKGQPCIKLENDQGDTKLVSFLEPVDYHPDNDSNYEEESFL